MAAQQAMSAAHMQALAPAGMPPLPASMGVALPQLNISAPQLNHMVSNEQMAQLMVAAAMPQQMGLGEQHHPHHAHAHQQHHPHPHQQHMQHDQHGYQGPDGGDQLSYDTEDVGGDMHGGRIGRKHANDRRPLRFWQPFNGECLHTHGQQLNTTVLAFADVIAWCLERLHWHRQQLDATVLASAYRMACDAWILPACMQLSLPKSAFHAVPAQLILPENCVCAIHMQTGGVAILSAWNDAQMQQRLRHGESAYGWLMDGSDCKKAASSLWLSIQVDSMLA